MKTWQIKSLALAAAGCLGACAHSGDSAVLQYQGSVLPTRAGDYCVATDTTRLISLGTLDLAVTKNYRMFAYLVSLMRQLPVTGENPSQNDTNVINITSMTVSVDSGMEKGTPFAQPSTAPNHGSLPASTWTVPMTGQIVPGAYLIGAVDLVPETAGLVPIGDDWRSRFFTAAAAKDFSKTTVVLRFQFNGVTLSGDNVITDAATMPLEVCYGCLLEPVTVSPASSPNQYFAGCGTADVPAAEVLPCIPGQEDFIDCRFYCHECQQASTVGEKTNYDKCLISPFCQP